jgi:hypothetical protein
MIRFSISILLVIITFGKAIASESDETSIKPSLAYRYSVLQPRQEAVYFKQVHKDYVDQFYATFSFQRQVDYVHDLVIEPTLRSVRDNPRQYQWLFEQAYIETQVRKNYFLTAGKKHEFSGSGFFVQPSDLLNEYKDSFDPLYQSEGMVFSRLQWRGEESSFGLGVIPERAKDRKEGHVWAVGNTEIVGVELNMQYKYHLERERGIGGVSAAKFFGDLFELHLDASYRGYQKSRDTRLQGTDYSAKGIDNGKGHYNWRDYSAVEEMDASGYYLAGTRVVLSARRTLILEYFVQQNGLLPEEFEALFEDLQAERDSNESGDAIVKVPRFFRGRHYAAFSYQDDDTIMGTHLGASYVRNNDDGSGYGGVSVKRHFSKATSLEFSPTYFVGSKGTEFGEMPFSVGYNILIRGRF